MSVGVVHDLAVGVDPGGADAWAMPDVLARDVTVGAPPDGFIPQGQDWHLPPWHPVGLAEQGYGAFRDVVRATLRGAAGLRIDHVMGLFRLWWIPRGSAPAQGAFVRYDEQAMLGTLVLEAERAGAIVIGEDLGTVEDRVAAELAGRGVLGSDVLWFQRDPQNPARFLSPGRWRAGAVGSVTTHDLPTAAGFLAGSHVELRTRLGLVGGSWDEEVARAAAERDALLDLLLAEGLVTHDTEPSPSELVEALYRLLGRSPCRIALAAPGDALGDLRQPNLPGTTDEYPNWRLPIATAEPDGSSRPVSLEEFMTARSAVRLARVLREAVESYPGTSMR
jgi:4-alpha-glucanotransferase